MAPVIPFKKMEVKAYLDRCVRYWRGKKAAGDATAEHYIDAFQSVRRTLFGDILPLDKTEPPDDLQEDAGVTTETDPEEKMCAACGHSESRHNTAGGFCKHCPCVRFIEKGDGIGISTEGIKVIADGEEIAFWLGGL